MQAPSLQYCRRTTSPTGAIAVIMATVSRGDVLPGTNDMTCHPFMEDFALRARVPTSPLCSNLSHARCTVTVRDFLGCRWEWTQGTCALVSPWMSFFVLIGILVRSSLYVRRESRDRRWECGTPGSRLVKGQSTTLPFAVVLGFPNRRGGDINALRGDGYMVLSSGTMASPHHHLPGVIDISLIPFPKLDNSYGALLLGTCGGLV